jgi:UDP-GlcNAc:undecaprenyl-phosphate GlcNAc-1-phosphate transferase
MRAAGTAFLAATVAAGILTPVVRMLARRFGALDHALTSRKAHGKPIPRLGGIAIVVAFHAPLVALLFVPSDVGQRFWAHPEKALGLLGGGLAIAALGIYDDLKGANAKTKFLVQFAVAAVVYAVGFRIDRIANPWGAPVELGWLGLPFTLLWIAGVVNALNLIDGLDGLAGGVALIAISTTLAIAVLRGEPLMVLFAAALAGAVLGFLIYNFNPATIFMGDTGSMFLGFVLATTAIQTNQKSSTAVALGVPIIALGVPIADTLLAMARRAARGAPLFSADRGHIHHRLLALGFSHRATVLVLYAASIALGGVALAFTYASSSQMLYVLVGLSVAAYFALRKLGYIKIVRSHDVHQMLGDRKRNLEMRVAIRRVGEALRLATSLSDVWIATWPAARALGASAIALRLAASTAQAGAESDPAFTDGFDDDAPELFRVRLGVVPERPGENELELGFADGRRTLDRDTEIAVELLCDYLCTALERIGARRETPIPGRVVGLRR